jgi:regulation of enolase protein 1 (concanavalin A-like superfamily)
MSGWKFASISILAGLLAPAVLAADKTTPTIPGWGRPVDPDGDCKIRADGDKLLFEIPGTKHDLSVEVGDVNAPRVIRPIEGDFIAQVTVSGNLQHNGKGTSDKFSPYHGAGLLIWLDGQTYIRLERALTIPPDREAVHYVNFELRKDGKMADWDSAVIPISDTTLRIERRGAHVYGQVSLDGIHWTALKPIDVQLPKEVKLGVAAINTSSEVFRPEFTDFETFKQEPREAAQAQGTESSHDRPKK